MTDAPRRQWTTGIAALIIAGGANWRGEPLRSIPGFEREEFAALAAIRANYGKAPLAFRMLGAVICVLALSAFASAGLLLWSVVSAMR